MSRYPYIDRHPCIVAPKAVASIKASVEKVQTYIKDSFEEMKNKQMETFGERTDAFARAGRPVGDPCETVKATLQDVNLQDKVEVLKKQLGLIDVKDYGPEWLKTPDEDVSGAFTEIRHCLRPTVPTRFQAIDEEIKNTIYDSYWNKSLGKTRDPTPGLPIGMKPDRVTMGKPGDYLISGSDLISPPKKAEEVEEEDRFYHDLYAFSHQNHYPGQQIRQGYRAPFNINNTFGRPSNRDDSGKRVKQCLTWFNDDPLCHVSRRLAAVRNRILPAVGKGLDKTGVTDIFPEDHAYGKPNDTDFYGVADLLNECPPSLMRRDMLMFLAYVNSLRQSIYKKINNGDVCMEELYEEILSLNKKPEDSNCSVHYDCIDRIMKRHNIYLDKNKLQPLLLTLGMLSGDGEIKVRDFFTVIDKNARFPDIGQQYYILPPEFQTCNSKDDKDPKDDYRIQSMPRAGMPTVRLDKPYPIFENSIVNMNHLSEETTARTLISPSIYTQYGLSHRDFFQPRSKEFLGNLFRKINVALSDEEVDEMYKEGYDLDQTGGVCVETFRNILDDRANKAYNKFQ